MYTWWLLSRTRFHAAPFLPLICLCRFLSSHLPSGLSHLQLVLEPLMGRARDNHPFPKCPLGQWLSQPLQ